MGAGTEAQGLAVWPPDSHLRDTSKKKHNTNHSYYCYPKGEQGRGVGGGGIPLGFALTSKRYPNLNSNQPNPLLPGKPNKQAGRGHWSTCIPQDGYLVLQNNSGNLLNGTTMSLPMLSGNPCSQFCCLSLILFSDVYERDAHTRKPTRPLTPTSSHPHLFTYCETTIRHFTRTAEQVQDAPAWMSDLRSVNAASAPPEVIWKLHQFRMAVSSSTSRCTAGGG